MSGRGWSSSCNDGASVARAHGAGAAPCLALLQRGRRSRVCRTAMLAGPGGALGGWPRGLGARVRPPIRTVTTVSYEADNFFQERHASQSINAPITGNTQ